MMDRNLIKQVSMRNLSENEMWLLIVAICRDPYQKSINVGSWQRRRAILWADKQIGKFQAPNTKNQTVTK
jgi:hypothetical protein